MHLTSQPLDRRSFIKSTATVAAGLAALGAVSAADKPANKSQQLALGFDNFSIRALGLKAPALLDYAAEQKCDAILISDLDAYESLETPYLKDIRKKAGHVGVKLYAGTWSICPTSKSFKDKWGTAEEHLALAIRVAHDLGSPTIRCVLGMGPDRETEGGIEARIADTAKVCRANRTRAQDAGVKIAIENHAGDMQAEELLTLIEAAGSDYVGATLDAGNATWTMEDPIASLDKLGPHTLCTGIRDSMIWEDAEGAKVQWMAVGDGLVDWKRYVERFNALCPNAPFIVEIICGFNRNVPYLRPSFWKVWPKAKASELAGYIAMAKRGHALEAHNSPDPKAEQAYQKEMLERSLRYCKETLGLGMKA